MLARISLLVLFFAAALVVAFASAQDKVAQPESAKKPSVEQLIRRLGSNDFETREAATRALTDRPDALAALQKALRSDDAEVRRRAATILDEQHKRARQKQVQRALAFLNNGEIDTFIDLVTSMELPLEDEIWQAMCAFVVQVADAVEQKRALPAIKEITEKKLSRDWSTDKNVNQYHRFCDCRLVAQELTKREDFTKCLLVCKGNVEASYDIRDVIVFTNGDFACTSGLMWNSIIISDGTIPFERLCAGTCVLIARGKDGKGTIEMGRGYLEQERKVGALVRFFDPAQVGIEVVSGKGGVIVKKVHDGKPFAVAGVKEDDLLTALDGAAIDSPESFRKLLRAKRAKGGDFVVQLRRADHLQELTVHLPN